MPENIRKARNIAIILAHFELLCCFLSFGFYVRRRSRLVLALIVFCFFTTVMGFLAKIKLSYCRLLAHACTAIPVIGGFYIYCLIDSIIT